MVMRVSQVEKVERPSKSLKWTKACSKESCSASSASSRFLVMRKATRKSFLVWGRHISSKSAEVAQREVEIPCLVFSRAAGGRKMWELV